MEKWTLKNKSRIQGGDLGECVPQNNIWITAPSHIRGGEMERTPTLMYHTVAEKKGFWMGGLFKV